MKNLNKSKLSEESNELVQLTDEQLKTIIGGDGDPPPDPPPDDQDPKDPNDPS
ncbi:MAG: bacteriocin [Bacteroidales bacterium]|nr:bacteriocin [Bacteroidales bacterium]